MNAQQLLAPGFRRDRAGGVAASPNSALGPEEGVRGPNRPARGNRRCKHPGCGLVFPTYVI